MKVRLFHTPALPVHWVAIDNEGNRWLVPARNNGWSDRTPYRGNYTLEAAPDYAGLCLGLPKSDGRLITIKTDGTIETIDINEPPSLETLQGAVGGHVELIPAFYEYEGVPCIAYCNEEGKSKNLPVNDVANAIWNNPLDCLVGNIVIIASHDLELLK